MGKKGPNAKLQKNRAYYKRFVVKFRRRRQGKTDYAQRTKLVRQDKNKYNMKKYRLVARITNKDVICQVVYAEANHDRVLAAAYAHELPAHGLKVGLTNYAACYCTGLLLARRLLKKIGMDKYYEGNAEASGDALVIDRDEDGDFGDDEEKNPFKCFLDVGLRRTSTGARVFGCLKGATDGGLCIPHRERRFPGFIKAKDGDDDAEDRFEADIHRDYILGGHVGKYMKYLQENDEARYKKQFSRYIAEGIEADDLEALYTGVHASIRANPDRAAAKKGDMAAFKSDAEARKSGKAKGGKTSKLSKEQRKARVLAKIAALQKVDEEDQPEAMAVEEDGDDGASSSSS